MVKVIEDILSVDMNIRKNTVEQIISEKKMELGQDLIKIAQNGPTYAKIDAIKAYCGIMDKSGAEEIYQFLKNKDWHIRLEAINGIANVLGKEAIDVISPYLKDRAYGVRSEVEGIIERLQAGN